MTAVYSPWFWAALLLSKKPLGASALGFTLLSWAAALWVWSVFVYILWRRDEISFEHPAELATIAEFFLWHLVNLIPLIDVDETLTWSMPLGYEDPLVGVCVLLYQVCVVIPVIALARRAWRDRTG